jgi:glutathione S-transferase
VAVIGWRLGPGSAGRRSGFLEAAIPNRRIAQVIAGFIPAAVAAHCHLSYSLTVNGRAGAKSPPLAAAREGSAIILYGSSLSPFVRKVLAYAGEKGIELEVKPIRPGDPDPEFREASPFGKMPGFRDGDYALGDSSAIIHYLEAKHPDPALIPAEPRARGKVIWFEEFADTILTSCGAKMFFNRIVAPRFLGRPGDLSAADVAQKEELPPILDYLESVVPEAGGFLVGDALTLADLAVASPFANLVHVQCDICPERHGRVRAYVESILSRPSFAPWIEREIAFLAQQAA